MKKIDKDLQKKIEQYFLLFVIYSVIGWVFEVIVLAIYEHDLVNRGLLIGPYCPIYGFGFLLIDLCLKKYKDKPALLFVMAMIIATILEYLTSLLLEVVFGIQLWDYSKNFLNLNGRVCLTASLAFGVLAVLIVYKVNPAIVSKIEKIPETVLKYLTMVIGVIMLLDVCVSYQIIFNIKDGLKKIGDSTNELSSKVWEAIQSNNY